MRPIFFLLVLFFVAKNLKAQSDTIILVTGQKIPAIVKEISDKYIKYKNPKDSLGPTLVIRKKLVEGFVLKNGCIELKAIGYENCVKDPTYGVLKEEDFKRKIINVDLSQFIISNLQMNFEYIPKKRNLGFIIQYTRFLKDPKYVVSSDYITKFLLRMNPVSNNENSFYFKLSSISAQLKLYPYVHKKATYFMSFGFDIGKTMAKVEREDLVYTYDPIYNTKNGYYFSNTTKYYNSFFQSLTYSNGGVFRPSKNFVIQLYGFIGVNRFIDPPPPSYMIQPKRETATFFVRYGIGLSTGIAF